MAEKPIKVTFKLDAADARYFRRLYRQAKKASRNMSSKSILSDAKALVDLIRETRRVPDFVVEAVDNLDALIRMLDDPNYPVPKKVETEVIAALAYFENPNDLIPDHIPAFGFLDDAIMIKFVENELKHEIWGYKKFCSYRENAEQRPWTKVAEDRLPKKLEEYHQQIRGKIRQRKEAEILRRKTLNYLGWS